jgi:23S rRNA (cytidine1920-2'-O)/16S rRNA (cytidine1409-2'-O)-methyltransferase
VALIKPQFEAGPEAVGKGGIVRGEDDRARAIGIVRAWLAGQPGWRVHGIVTWPGLQGRSNEEYLIGALRDG